jgi:hypothetical protein
VADGERLTPAERARWSEALDHVFRATVLERQDRAFIASGKWMGVAVAPASSAAGGGPVLPGSRFGRYEVEQHLGRGGMARRTWFGTPSSSARCRRRGVVKVLDFATPGCWSRA